MTNLLVLKEYLKGIYGKYEIYITPVEKFLLSLITLILINRKLGYMSRLNSTTIVLVAALLCSFLPMNIMVLFAALFILLHLYAFSLECAIVVLALFLVMFLMYFRFASKDTVMVLLTPICCYLNIPFVMPLAATIWQFWVSPSGVSLSKSPLERRPVLVKEPSTCKKPSSMRIMEPSLVTHHIQKFHAHHILCNFCY